MAALDSGAWGAAIVASANRGPSPMLAAVYRSAVHGLDAYTAAVASAPGPASVRVWKITSR